MIKYIIPVIILSSTIHTKIIDGEKCREYIVQDARTKNIGKTYILKSERWEKGDTVNILKINFKNK